jgi:hypothetical protein
MGIVCSPWPAFPPSVLRHTPFEIAVSLLETIGIDLRPIMDCHCIEMRIRSIAVNSHPGWWDLGTVPIFQNPLNNGGLKGTIFPSFFRQFHQQAGQNESRRVLRSDQLFLGNIKSPRPDNLNIAPRKCPHPLGQLLPTLA